MYDNYIKYIQLVMFNLGQSEGIDLNCCLEKASVVATLTTNG